jgi:hypothetical protein
MNGIDVAGVADLPLDEGLALFDQKLNMALAKLQQEGFYMPNAPYYNHGGVSTYYRGELPTDLTEQSDQQLGWYLSMLSTWNAYVQTKLAEADLNRTITEEKLKFLTAKLNVALIGHKTGNKALTGPQVKAIVESDRRYVEINITFISHSAVYKMVKAAAEAAETNWWTVSRRITQRGQELERDRRTPGAGGNTTPRGPLFGTRRMS